MKKISIMQGRTICSENNTIQSFPFQSWIKEFPFLKNLKIKKLQWIYENSKNYRNPILSRSFLKRKFLIKKNYNVTIDSICADEFIKRPIISRRGIRIKSFEELIKIIQISNKCKIKYIIIPFVDKSSIRKLNYEKYLKEFIILIYPFLEIYNIEVHLETDIKNKIITKIIKSTQTKKFIKINFDSGNTVSLGYDMVKEIIDAKDHLGSVHIKDRIRFGSTVPLGYGDVNFINLFKTLKSIKYNGDYVLQAARVRGMEDRKLISKYLVFLKNYL